jgi:hypothetical protein
MLGVAFFEQDDIQQLGERHGASGPLLIWRSSLRQAARSPPRPPGTFNVVEGRYTSLARRAQVTTDETRAILETAAEMELVELIATEGPRYKARLLK